MSASEAIFTFEGELEFCQECLDYVERDPALLPDSLYVQARARSGPAATLEIEGVDPVWARPLDGRRVRVTVELI